MPEDTKDTKQASLTIRLLGPMHIQVQGQPLPTLRSRSGLWLLALLILRYPRPVERDYLAGTLWPESTQEQALANLRQRLSELRRVLGNEGRRLLAPTAHTLRLDLQGAQVDLLDFDAALQNKDLQSLQQAIGLYSGPLLEGCQEEWVFQERQQREQGYLSTLEALAAQATEQNKPDTAARYLQLALSVDPLREPCLQALMQALAALGDYAAIQQVYRDFRLRLYAELHSEPAPETVAIYRQIQADSQQRRSRRSEDGREQKSVSVSGRRTASRLPKPLSSLIGREKEIQEIKDALGSARLVTITGSGGIGKTRLAIQVAQDLSIEVPDGVWFIDLAPLTTSVSIASALASALELREEPGRALAQTVTKYLQNRQSLLVLDNCEHLIQECALLASTLLQGCADLRILATSRQPLELSGERVWRAPSLALPDRDRFPADEKEAVSVYMEVESIRLFMERARLVHPQFGLTGQNAEVVARICIRLDGIPLAIELAAAWVRTLSVVQIADRLGDRFRLLTGGDYTRPARYQTLRGTMDWSYDLLGEPERVLLRRLSVFAGGCTLEAAEEVCGGGESREVLTLLTSLMDKSLVNCEHETDQIRYTLLETIRQYGQERLNESGESEAIHDWHAAYFLRLAEDISEDRILLFRERLEAERENLRAALEWSETAAGRTDLALRLAAAIWESIWEFAGDYTEAQIHLDIALSLPGAQRKTRPRAMALLAAASYESTLKDTPALRRPDLEAAQAYAEESMAIFQDLGEKEDYARVLNTLSGIKLLQRDNAAARTLSEEALVIFQELRLNSDIFWTLCALGKASRAAGNPDAARVYWEQAQSLACEEHFGFGVFWTKLMLAELLRELGDFETAHALAEESLSFTRALRSSPHLEWALFITALLRATIGDFQGSRTLLEELVTHKESKAREVPYWVFIRLGEDCCDLGDHAAAQAYLERGMALTSIERHEAGRVVCMMLLGEVLLGDQDKNKACALYRNGLSLLGETRNLSLLAWALEKMAALSQGKWAACLLGAAEALQEAGGGVRGPGVTISYSSRRGSYAQQKHENTIAALRSTLGEEEFAAAWAQGRAMTIEQAIAYALEGIGCWVSGSKNCYLTPNIRSNLREGAIHPIP